MRIEFLLKTDRGHNITPYENLPCTHIQKIGGNSSAPTSETMIDYVLSNKGCKK